MDVDRIVTWLLTTDRPDYAKGVLSLEDERDKARAERDELKQLQFMLATEDITITKGQVLAIGTFIGDQQPNLAAYDVDETGFGIAMKHSIPLTPWDQARARHDAMNEGAGR